MNSTTAWLGWLGLIPFVGLSSWIVFANGDTSAIFALNLYAFGIISFLTGSWWRNQISDQPTSQLLLLSNGFFLAAFFALLLFSEMSLVILALILLGTLVIEQFTTLVGLYRQEYRRMRLWLSSVASGSMILAFLFQSGGTA
jgi:hypothetical protein